MAHKSVSLILLLTKRNFLSPEEQAVIKQILQHLGLWEIRNTGPPPRTDLNIVLELAYQPVPDQAPADDGFFSQVPDYGYWAE